MERYLKNHAGPTGYGLVHNSESLPLMTGTYFHKALETLWLYLQANDALPPREVVRQAIADANKLYEKKIERRGFRGLLASESSDRVIVEQQCLIAGLVWGVWRNVLPWIHTHYRVLQAELESIYVLECTCGLGSAVLDASAHDAKGCHGIGQMLKQDALAEKREGGGLAYFESKSTGWGGDNWAPQWETKPQLSIGTFGVAERYGKEVSELFILAGYKGARRTSKPKDVFEEAITRQDSPFCYGYSRPGNPPLSTDDWLPSYEWTDEAGATRRVSRVHEKRGVWELPQSDWPVWENRPADDRSVMEFWIDQLPQSVLDSTVYLIGPLNRQDAQIQQLKKHIVGEERHWQEIVWRLFPPATNAAVSERNINVSSCPCALSRRAGTTH
jgi:hypothetical protein